MSPSAAFTSWAVTRSFEPERRTAPSSTVATLSFAPTSCAGTFLPLKVNAELRAATRSPCSFQPVEHPVPLVKACMDESEVNRSDVRPFRQGGEVLENPAGLFELAGLGAHVAEDGGVIRVVRESDRFPGFRDRFRKPSLQK